MRIDFSIKLGIGVVLFFAALIGGMTVYRPLCFLRLESRLKSNDPEVRRKAISGIVRKGDGSLPFLRFALLSEDMRVVTGACEALKEMKEKCWKKTLPEMGEVLDGPPTEYTDACASVLMSKKFNFEKEWGNYRARVRNMLIFLYHNPERYYDRADSVRKLGKYGDGSAVGMLVGVLRKDPDSRVRYEAVVTLQKFGGDRAVDAICNSARMDRSELVRMTAVDALGRMGDPYAIGPLCEILESDKSVYCRKAAAYSLSAFDEDIAVESLGKALLNNSRIRVRLAAATSLNRPSNRNVYRFLISSLKKETSLAVQERVVRAMWRRENENTVPELIDILRNSGSEFARTGAASALRELKADDALPDLIHALENDESVLVCSAAAEAVGVLGDRSATRALLAVMQSDNGAVREATEAIIALGYNLEVPVEGLMIIIKNNSYPIATAWAADKLGSTGEIKALEALIEIYAGEYDSTVFLAVVKWLNKGTPDGFPRPVLYYYEKQYDGYEEVTDKLRKEREKSARLMREWLDENRDRMRWNRDLKRWFLKEDAAQEKKSNAINFL